MSCFSLTIRNRDGQERIRMENEKRISMVFRGRYEEGDSIVFTADQGYYVIQLDDAMGEELVYMSGGAFTFAVPHGEKRDSYSPKAFMGGLHLLTMRPARREEAEAYRNLARNRYDQHVNDCVYPHAWANVETRGETQFAAKNAINGNTENTSHGSWPYESWGINRQEDAEITVSFGRPVTVERVVVYVRGDWPHDNWWEKGMLTFSDGSVMTVKLAKTHDAQEFQVEPRQIEWIKLGGLIKGDDPSPFPALTQIEVWGR